eukprot:TRINITY_DN26429_c0_g1_i1.p2 TRINITY_DN26429_c0_g1~~TRINITY_DN26429_c0_g1_i1.p2  ORF type:complete len:163 (-),score=40.64 TRINITY_DN26429_c0_g1_i1:10-498(-)
MRELTNVFGNFASEFLKFCDENNDESLSREEFIAGILKDTQDLSDDDFQRDWLDRMSQSIQDAKIGQWQQIPSEGEIPKTRSSHGLSFNPDDGHLYLWGGEHEARHAIDSTLWRCTQEGTWNQVETVGEPPEPRVAHAQAIINNTLYIFGGRQGVTLGDGDL